MTSSDPPPPARARRSRRAVRHAGTVGGDDANLVSTHPALGSGTPQPGANAVDISQARGTDTSRSPADAGATPRDRGTRDTREVSGRVDVVPTTTAQAAHEPVVATRSADDSDVGWGDRESGSNDDRLHQEKPPHW